MNRQVWALAPIIGAEGDQVVMSDLSRSLSAAA